LPGKAIPEMTYTVSSGTLNHTHLLKTMEHHLPYVITQVKSGDIARLRTMECQLPYL